MTGLAHNGCSESACAGHPDGYLSESTIYMGPPLMATPREALKNKDPTITQKRQVHQFKYTNKI